MNSLKLQCYVVHFVRACFGPHRERIDQNR